MAEPMVWDLDRPTPNVALERIRLALLSTDDIYLVLDALLGLLDDATAQRDQLRADLDALTGRVAALELPPPEPPPDLADPLPLEELL